SPPTEASSPEIELAGSSSNHGTTSRSASTEDSGPDATAMGPEGLTEGIQSLSQMALPSDDRAATIACSSYQLEGDRNEPPAARLRVRQRGVSAAPDAVRCVDRSDAAKERQGRQRREAAEAHAQGTARHRDVAGANRPYGRARRRPQRLRG